MTTAAPRRRMRRAYLTSGALLIAGALLPPTVSLAIVGDDLAASMKYGELDAVEFSDVIDDRYTNRVDVLSVAKGGDSIGRETVIYVDLERRDDCQVVDKYTAEPGIECANNPKPTEVEK